MINRNMKITNTCPFCGTRHVVWVDNVDYASWTGGTLVQNAFPYLNSTERENSSSLTCAHSVRQMSLGKKTKTLVMILTSVWRKALHLLDSGGNSPLSFLFGAPQWARSMLAAG